MAGSDELIWMIRFQPDEESVRKVGEVLDNLSKKYKDSGISEAAKGNKDYTESMDELNKSNLEGIERLIELQKALDKQRSILSSIKKAKKDDVELSHQQRAQEVNTQAALKTTSQEYRNKQASLIAATTAMDKSNFTYAQVVANNRNIAAAMKNLPLNDTTGKLANLKKEWHANNEVLKKFDAKMGDHRRNVGNYGEALTTAASAVAAIQGPLGPIAGRISSINMTLQRATPLIKAKAAAWGVLKTAMIASGIGAIIVLLGTFLVFLRKMQPVMDAVTKKFDQIGAVVGFLSDRIGAFFGMNEKSNYSLSESIRITGELADAQRKLEDQQIENIVTNAKLEESIAKLRREAEDETNADADRISMMEQALEKTEEMFAERVRIAEEEFRIAKQKADLARNERADNEALAEAEAKVIKLRAQADTQSLMLVRRRQSIINQRDVEIKQRQRLIEKINDTVEGYKKESAELVRSLGITMSIRQMGFETEREAARLRERGMEREAVILEAQHEAQMLIMETEEKISEARDKAAEKSIKLKEMYIEQGLSQEQAAAKATQETEQELLNQIEALHRAHFTRMSILQTQRNDNFEEIDKKKVKVERDVLDEIASLREKNQMEETVRALARTTGQNEEILRIEQQRVSKQIELEKEFVENGIDPARAAELASYQAREEYARQFYNTKQNLARQAAQFELQQLHDTAAIATNTLEAIFFENKAARVAQAVINTAAAITEVLAAPGLMPVSVRMVRAAAIGTAGAAQVRQIMSTNIGSASVVKSVEDPRGLGFNMSDFGLPFFQNAPSSQVAGSPSRDTRPFNPTFIFEGDMDKEVMAIKVREGNSAIEGRTISTTTPVES